MKNNNLDKKKKHRATVGLNKSTMPRARQGNENVPAVLRQTFYWINVDHPNRIFLLSNLFESNVKKKKKGHGSRKVFIFSKTYKENFAFLRGRGNKAESKDSTVTTLKRSRGFFFFGGIYLGSK